MCKVLLLCCLAVSLLAASLYGQQPDDGPKSSGEAKQDRGGKGKGGGFKGMGKGKGGSGFGEARARWEYKVATLSDIVVQSHDLQAGLNKLGDDGWELVAIEGPTGAATAYFKRSRPGFAPPLSLRADGEFNSPAFIFAGKAGPSGLGDSVKGPSAVPAKATAKDEIAIIALKNAHANQLANMLQNLNLRGNVRFVADQRTDSIVVSAPEDRIGEIRDLINRLDQPAQSPRLVK